MATRQALSTISYNSREFLLERLNVWLNSHIIQAFMVAFHKGEDGDKDHAHVRIEPNKTLDPMDLAETLKEYVPGEKKPLGVRPWRYSKEEDWILYAVHDAEYMRQKYPNDPGEKIPYDWRDIVVSDGFDMEVAFIRAKAKQAHTPSNLAKRIQGGENALSLVREGENVFLVNALNKALYEGDYAQLSARYNRLEEDFHDLEMSVQRYGFVLVRDEDGRLSVEPGVGCNFVPF